MGLYLKILSVTLFAASVCFGLAGGAYADDSFTQQQLDHFENKVRPILVNRCNECHAGGESEGGLSLRSRKSMLAGGETGAAIVPGDPDNSLLVKALHYDDVYQMPPDSKLPEEEIRIIEDWIRESAPWPKLSDEEAAVAESSFDIEVRKKEHWCWQPVVAPKLPAATDSSKAIDWLLEKRLAEEGLKPNGPAVRSSLLRRISFDLTGLPPSLELVQQYAIDETLSTEQVVDQLLESPHFGERWARHWMDLARYAETHGHEFDYPIYGAWQYRDYLIRAFNADVPYDQFVVEHVAGDLLDDPRRNPDSDFNESVIATAFWFLGEATHAPVDSKEDEARRIDNQIDVMCRSFVGLTVACARCHDHKFDAISTKDYYALSGFFQSSRRQRQVIDKGRRFETAARKIGVLRNKLQAATDALMEQVAAVDSENLATRLAEVDPPRLRTRPEQFSNESVGETSSVEFPLSQEHWKTDGLAFAGMHHGTANSINSGVNGDRFSGVAHSSTFEIKHRFIHIRAKAKKARIELVVDGFRMHEFNALLFKGLIHKNVNHDDFQWITIGRELYLHLGSRAWLEFQDLGEGSFEVDRIVFSHDRKPPKDPVETFDVSEIGSLIKGPHANDLVEWILNNNLEGQFGADASAGKIRSLKKQIEAIDSELSLPWLVYVMTEGFPENEFVFVRGNHKTPGEVAPRQFLTALVGDDDSLDRAKGSGRLHLAKQIVDPSNPLTSRVIVNRVWHHLFGRGIVRSVDNFGVLGEKPSHPKLLDHLADEFVKDGWSIKRLIRKLMLTEAYARSSSPLSDAAEKDPENILLARANVCRLQGEAIRDAMFAASGRLDRKMFGVSVPVHITPFMNGRGRPKESGQLDSGGRRSIYIATRRNFLSPMMLAFDTPIPFNAIGRRSVSNVPAQVLILMNDPLVLQQAETFAKRVIEKRNGIEQRIEYVYLNALGRRPDENEFRKSEAFIKSHASRLKLDVDDVKVWADFCHVVFNVKEFIWLN